MRFVILAAALLSAGLAIAETPDATMRPSARPVPVDPLAGFRPLARPVTDVITDDEAYQLIAAGPPLRATISSSSVPEDFVTSRERDTLTGPLALGSVEMRPQVRPGDEEEAEVIAAVLIRPATRPQGIAERAVFLPSPFAVTDSLRPNLRPAAFVREAEERQAARVRGQVCGDPDIQGEVVGRVEGPGACGIDGAVRVKSVAGVALTARSVMDCRTAQALKTWVENGARPAVGAQGGGIAAIRVIGTYSCRNRNGSSSGRLSEHANGRAIDIAGIRLQNGREMTVLTDWNGSKYSDALRQMWRAACGPFGTVLGPNANRAHRDHFHFDTARYRSGSYCR